MDEKSVNCGGKGARCADPMAARIMVATAKRLRIPVEQVQLSNRAGKGPNRSARAKLVAVTLMREKLSMSYPEIADAMGASSHSTPMHYGKSRMRERFADTLAEDCAAVWAIADQAKPIQAPPPPEKPLPQVCPFDRGIGEAVASRIAAGYDPDAPNPVAVGLGGYRGTMEAVEPAFQISILSGLPNKNGPRVASTHETPAGAIQDAVAAAVAALDFATREMERLGWPEDQTREALAPLLGAIRKVDRRLMSVVI